MMRHVLLAIGLVALIGQPDAAEEPKPKGEPKPPWERVLSTGDQKKVADLQKQVREREAADDYAEAIKAAEALRVRCASWRRARTTGRSCGRIKKSFA